MSPTLSCLVLVDGGWSEWQTQECSVTCGKGEIIRQRECNNPAPLYGGADCVGESRQHEPCKKEKCPSKELIMISINHILQQYEMESR